MANSSLHRHLGTLSLILGLNFQGSAMSFYIDLEAHFKKLMKNLCPPHRIPLPSHINQ